MKATIALLALAGAVSARQNYMQVMALRSASPIHFHPVTASGFRLHLGGTTASYCPEVVNPNCPPGNMTTLLGGEGGLSMGSEVPGGQTVWIDSCTGEIGYTQAHSASIPANAILGGWSVTENYTAGGLLGRLDWENGLLACPTANGSAPWQIYANLAKVKFSDECLGFDAVFSNSSEPSAWQYI